MESKIKELYIQWSALIVFIALALCSSQPLMAQVIVIGEVKAEDKQPVPFANVLLLQPTDSSLVLGSITSAEGKFSLNVQPGAYLINISMMGYQSIFSLIEISTAQEKVYLNAFYLPEDVKQLDEIVVKGQKPLFEKQTDRTVVNVQSSITTAGNTALAVLEKSPGVVVNRQNNSLALNGKTGVLVMINGKVNRLPIDAVVQMLDGMSAANIEKIELITSPPAKYDAEGNAGIIHIVMTENPDTGTNGNFGITLGYNKAETLGGNFNLNHRSKRLNTFLNYSIHHDRNRHEWINERYRTVDNFTQTNMSSSHRKPLTIVQNLQAGVAYDFNDKTTASLLITGYRRKWDMTAETSNFNTITVDSTYVTKMSILEINKWQSASGSLGLKHQLDERQEINLSFDYLYYHNHNPSGYINETSLNKSPVSENEMIRVEKLTPINFKIANFDYTNNVSAKWSVDAGVKGTLSQFTNNVSVRRRVGDEMIIDPALTNLSNLDEKILAAYGAWQWQPHLNWSIQGGLRYEYTDTYLSTPEEDGVVDRQFGNLFPSLFVTHNLNEKSKLQMAYNRRITRPTFNDMAPFVFFIGPNTFVAGNLSLKPAISDGVDVSYQLKQWWVSLKYSYSQDEIAFLQPEYNAATDEQIFRSQNLKYMQTYGISTTFPVEITSWWEMQNDVSFYFYDYETQHLENNVHRSIKSLTLNTNNSFKLPENFSVEVSGYYQSASVFGISQFRPLGRLNFGIKKVLKNDAVITLAVNDLLNTSIWKLETDVEDNLRSFMFYDWGIRSINLTYSHSFGNKKLKTVNIQSGSETERKRVQ